jgi:uncharacterized protein (TIGR03000 family)
LTATVARRPGGAVLVGFPIDAVRVGPRARKEPGDLDAPTASVAGVGLPHPIVVPPDPSGVPGAGVPVAGSGAVRRSRSPPLGPGRDHAYPPTARWVDDGGPVPRPRRVTVRAGRQALASFLAG